MKISVCLKHVLDRMPLVLSSGIFLAQSVNHVKNCEQFL